MDWRCKWRHKKRVVGVSIESGDKHANKTVRQPSHYNCSVVYVNN